MLIKLIAKVILNGIALYLVSYYFSGFKLGGGVETLVVASVVLALLNMIVRPILKLVTAPLLWLSFGLFNIVINLTLLWIADQLLTSLVIENLTTLFWASFIIALANSFF